MKRDRHPHPHIDPRQPRDGSQPGTNPPVFAWKPIPGVASYSLTIARDAGLNDVCLQLDGLRETAHLPARAFAPGRYFWQWGTSTAQSEVFAFDILPQAAVLEVPPATEWLQRFPQGHPRLYTRPEALPELRDSRTTARAALWRELETAADALLGEPHEIAEPPFLPDRKLNYEAFYRVWYPTMWESRKFVKGAETLALAYLASGEARYARAACQRMASTSRWDPEGSSHIGHNDEAHMSVIWNGPAACDWVWDQFTDRERALVVDQFRLRGEITYDHMHDRGSYGVTRFDSHAGREIVFLALTAFVFHEHIPQASAWLEWLRPVLCGIWPVWAGDDGAWAEGLSYGLAYVRIMTMFATALKRGSGVDLYRRPFWRNHAKWRQYCLPPYAEWMGFGDHSERWASTWLANADLIELISRECETVELEGYAAAFRGEAKNCTTPADREMPGISALRYLSSAATPGSGPAPERGVHRVFPTAGWAAIRTDLEEPSEDVALIFRSSPFGSISHSHANNNDFIIHVGGKILAMPSGYYAGYGSDHHAHWVWHTKAHNCVTLSDATQILRSHDSVGAVQASFEDDLLVYFRGDADASYRDRAIRCWRHVVFLKTSSCFVMIDEFVALPGVLSALQWNIHSWNRFTVDEARRSFLVEREGSSLEGHLLFHKNGFFSLSEGWDPPPLAIKSHDEWHLQYHLRFTPSGLEPRRNLAVVMCPGHGSLARAGVVAKRVGETEVAQVGEEWVLVNQGEGIEYGDWRSNALALLHVQGCRYEVRDEGLSRTFCSEQAAGARKRR